MAKHKKDASDLTPTVSGTDSGDPFSTLDAVSRAAEFDASHADPSGYAARNFHPGNANGSYYESARAEQREQQARHRR